MKVYIIEDDESMCFILRLLLEENFSSISEIGESGSAEKALDEIPAFDPDLVLVDISLPGMDGIEMIRRLRPRYPDIHIIVVTGHDIEPYRQKALSAGADSIVSKMDDDELLRRIGDFIDET